MKKILSIDGGGIKGVFPASFLSSIENKRNLRVAEYFDLIVGTSTGGIIALGLGLGLSAAEILSFYERYGPKIFGGNRLTKWFRHVVQTKFQPTELKEALKKTFLDCRLGDSKVRLVVPSFNLLSGKVYLFKTAHHEHLETDYRESAVNVALATSAAPTYFPYHTTSSGVPLVDGGMWANNPMGLAAVEAIGILNWSKGNVKLLSIGCTSEALDVKRNGGRLTWAPKIADVFLSSQSSASIGTAQVLLGDENVLRINPTMPKSKFRLDSPTAINALKGLGASEAREANPKLDDYFAEEAAPFAPIHTS